jgi:hypothetical protein
MNWYRISPCPNYAISEDGVDEKVEKINKVTECQTLRSEEKKKATH